MSKSSSRWLKEHFNDPYVKKSWQDGYRSRAAYKLIELQNRYRFIKPNMRVVDLGAAPGSWSQVAVQHIGKRGQLIALDLLEIDPIPNVIFLQGDFTETAAYDRLLDQGFVTGRSVQRAQNRLVELLAVVGDAAAGPAERE